MRKLFELVKARLDLRWRQPAQAVATELFDVERGHHRAVNNSASQRVFINLVGLRQIAHKTARKTIARARRVKDRFERIGRRGKERVFSEVGCAVLTAFDDQQLWPQRENLARGANQVGFLRQLARFSVVDNQGIYYGNRLEQF